MRLLVALVLSLPLCAALALAEPDVGDGPPDLVVEGVRDGLDLAAALGAPSDPRRFRLVIAPGALVRAPGPGLSALTTGALPAGSVVEIVNQGRIVGGGGRGGRGGVSRFQNLSGPDGQPGQPGGDAIVLTVPTVIDSRAGEIVAGGGGGGGGGGLWWGCTRYQVPGGGGGGGAGEPPGPGGLSGIGIGLKTEAGEAGRPGALSAGGRGGRPGWGAVASECGEGPPSCTCGAGGRGGAPGVAGAYGAPCCSVGGRGGPGGAAGLAVRTNGHPVSWVGGAPPPDRVVGFVE